MSQKQLSIVVAFLLLLITGISYSCEDKRLLLRQSHRTYTLILTDTSQHSNAWLVKRKERKLPHQTIAISGYADETAKGLLQRLPWLLQPGVDTLVYDTKLAGDALVDSLNNYLQLNSPTTVLLLAN